MCHGQLCSDYFYTSLMLGVITVHTSYCGDYTSHVFHAMQHCMGVYVITVNVYVCSDYFSCKHIATWCNHCYLVLCGD